MVKMTITIINIHKSEFNKMYKLSLMAEKTAGLNHIIKHHYNTFHNAYNCIINT